jgi:hypothetical protein
MSKICLFQMKGVMGMWVKHIWPICILEPKSFWMSLYCLRTSKTFCTTHILYNSKWHFHSFLNCSKQIRNEENMKFENKGV